MLGPADSVSLLKGKTWSLLLLTWIFFSGFVWYSPHSQSQKTTSHFIKHFWLPCFLPTMPLTWHFFPKSYHFKHHFRMIILCIQVASCLYFCHSIYLLFHHHTELSVCPAHQPDDKLQCYSSRKIPPLQPAAIRNGVSHCFPSYLGIKASILPPGCLSLLSVTKGFAPAGKIPLNLVILKYLGGGGREHPIFQP